MAVKDSSIAQSLHEVPSIDANQNSVISKQLPTPAIASTDLAHSIGSDQANEWLNHSFGADDTSVMPVSHVAWRARCYADSVHEYEDMADFLQLLGAWENGFDSTFADAKVRPQPAPDAAHVPFSWFVHELQHDYRAHFAATTMDMCLGIDTCLELVYSSNLQRVVNEGADIGDEVPPTLTPSDTDRLLRLAMVSTKLLAESAEAEIDHMNRRARSYASKGAA